MRGRLSSISGAWIFRFFIGYSFSIGASYDFGVWKHFVVNRPSGLGLYVGRGRLFTTSGDLIFDF